MAQVGGDRRTTGVVGTIGADSFPNPSSATHNRTDRTASPSAPGRSTMVPAGERHPSRLPSLGSLGRARSRIGRAKMCRSRYSGRIAPAPGSALTQLDLPAARVHDPGTRPREAQPQGGLMSKPARCPENRHRFSWVSSDNQGENVATIKVRTRGRDATSARTMAVAGRRGKWERGGRVSGTAGMRRPCSADSGVFHRPGAASVASRDGAVEGGFSEG